MYWNKGKLYKKARGKRQCIMCQMEQKNVDFMNVKNVESRIYLYRFPNQKNRKVGGEKMDALLSLAITGGDDSWI